MGIALDSGIIGRAGARADLQAQVQSAVAHQTALPISSISANYVQVFDEISEALDCKAAMQVDRLSDLAPIISEKFDTYIRLVGLLDKRTLINSISFPHPMYRLLKDYHLVRIAEAYQLYWLLKEAPQNESTIRPYFPFPVNDRFKICVIPKSDRTFIFGPTFCDTEIDEGARREYAGELNACLETFQEALQTADKNLFRGHLHGDDQLIQAAFMRQKMHVSAFERRCQLAAKLTGIEESTQELKEIDWVSPNFFSKLVAAGKVVLEHDSGASFEHKIFLPSGDREVQIFHVRTKHEKLDVSTVTQRLGAESHVVNYADAVHQAFSNWQNFLSESTELLRSWLQKNSGALGPSDQTNEEMRSFGLKLARFLTFLFNGGECSIYKLNYDNSGAQLLPFAGYSRYPEPLKRLSAMAEHIEQGLHTPVERRSIVIRCFKKNSVQYCQWHNQYTGETLPVDQDISFPRHLGNFDWGVSLCAMPIRVSGVFWGVIEFVAMRPHAFPDVVRARISEIVGIVAPYLFERQVFSTLNSVNRIVVSTETTQEKKRSLRPLIRSLFACKSFAILRMDGSRQSDIKTFLESGRGDLVDHTSTPDHSTGDYLRPYLKFRDEKLDIWSCNIGDAEFARLFRGSHQKKFFQENDGDFICLARIEWTSEVDGNHSGVIVLTYEHEMGSQENWRSIIKFGCQYLATITETLHGTEAWETTVRQKLAHELTKTVDAVDSIVKSLSTSVQRLPRKNPAVDRPKLERIVGDFRRQALGLRNNARILKLNRVTRDFESDPRLYYVDQVLSEWRQNHKRKKVKFRNVYNSIFQGAKSEFLEKKLILPVLPADFNPRLDVDEWCLGEVLLTLKSNVLKYSVPGSEILVRESKAINYGLRISNIGYKLDPTEVRKIFFDEFRGDIAQEVHPEDGSGFGLWYVERVMKEMDCDIRHRQSDLTEGTLDQDRFAWHHFTLNFPWGRVQS